MSSTMEHAPPLNAGTKDNLPDEIRKIANIRSEVIAWTCLDPNLSNQISRYFCCRVFGMFLFLPCFWIHLIIMSPCLYCSKVNLENATRSQYWILTEQELKVVSTDHDQCCIPGLSSSGDVVKSIPLENITDCGLDKQGKGCANKHTADVPVIYVDTASNSGSDGNHEATGVALANYEWFIQQILNQRDVVKGRPGGVVAVTSVAPIGDRGDIIKSPAERIKELHDLYNTGLITHEEFETKRKDVIDSV